MLSSCVELMSELLTLETIKVMDSVGMTAQTNTFIEDMFCPHYRVRMLALKGLACRARVIPAKIALGRGARALHTTLAAAPVPFTHAFGPYHIEKTYCIAGNTNAPSQHTSRHK